MIVEGRRSKTGFQSGGECIPGRKEMTFVHPLKPTQSIAGHVAGDVVQPLVVRNGVVFKKLIGLKDPIERDT
jgi:hypothetical protein